MNERIKAEIWAKKYLESQETKDLKKKIRKSLVKGGCETAIKIKNQQL